MFGPFETPRHTAQCTSANRNVPTARSVLARQVGAILVRAERDGALAHPCLDPGSDPHLVPSAEHEVAVVAANSGRFARIEVRKVRAEHATRYLQNTRLPLSTIAYMVGFNDASNFRRAYLKWTGRSPREVRSGS